MPAETNVIERAAPSETFVTETPAQAAETHRASVVNMLQDPEAFTWNNHEVLASALDQLLQSGLTAHESKVLTDDQLSEIGDLSLTALSGFTGAIDEHRQRGIRFISGISDFGNVVDGLSALFDRTDASQPPTVEQDVQRTTTLLRFASKSRNGIHKKFVDKYIDKLTADNEETVPELEAVWQNPDFLAAMGARFGRNIESGSRSSWPDREQRLFAKTFEAFGFSEPEKQDLLNAVNSYKKGDAEAATKQRTANLIRSLEVMGSLMTTGPDTVHDIYKTFGIRNFNRYHAEGLYNQLWDFRAAQESEPKQPIRLVVAGTDDWNGAIGDVERKFDQTVPVYMEAGTIEDLARALIQAKKLGPVSTLIVHAHGSKHAMALSGSENGRLTTDMMRQSKGLTRLKDKGIFTKNAEIILASCSTGQEGGIAENISRLSGMAVFAASEPTQASIERDHTKPDKAIFNVLFPSRREPEGLWGKAKAVVKTPSAAVAYSAGKRIKSKSVDLSD